VQLPAAGHEIAIIPRPLPRERRGHFRGTSPHAVGLLRDEGLLRGRTVRKGSAIDTVTDDVHTMGPGAAVD